MKKLTPREEELMQIFWERGPLFVKDIVAGMPDPKPHTNTISTFVRILEEKDFSATTALESRINTILLFRQMIISATPSKG